MNRNECQNCKYYEKCGKPSRPIKCMGYEPKEAEYNRKIRAAQRQQ